MCSPSAPCSWRVWGGRHLGMRGERDAVIQNESLHTIGYIRYPMKNHIKLGGGSKELEVEEGHDRILSHGRASIPVHFIMVGHGRLCIMRGVKSVHEDCRARNVHCLS